MPLKTCPSCRSSYPFELEICPGDGSTLESEGWIPRAVVLGKYAILRRVSEDEVSVCYGVRVVESGEFRTVRALRSELSTNPSAAREFRRVGGVLQKVAHPNVLRVETVDQDDDGRPFLVTEFVGAPSLAEWLREGKPLESKRVCAVARGIAAGLNACHRLGLLHLALQPRNILVEGPSENPHVKVQGFETAHVWAVRGRDRLTAGKTPLRDLMPAALAYGSPEQVLARSLASVDARSDLYSLGVLMYQMLAGRLPFPGPLDSEVAALASLAARIEDAPAALAPGKTDGIPEALIELVTQLLERRPELRPATISSVSERIALIEEHIAAPSAAVLEVPSPAVEPVAVHAPEELPIPVELPPPVAEEVILAPLMPAQTLGELEITVPTPEAASVVALAPGPAGSGELHETPAAAASGDLSAGAPQWAGPNSILFRTEPAPGPAKSTRWVWAAAAALVLAAGTALFVHVGGLKWHGPGPLSPMTSEQVRTMMGESATGSTAPATSPPQSGTNQQPSANSAEGAAPPGPGVESPAGPVEPPAGNQPKSNAGQQQSAERRIAPTSPAITPPTSAGVSGSEKSSTTRKQEASPKQDEGMAEVNRAIAAGDVFFELGQYDLAVRTYEGPLKLDPNNKLLRSRIDRALKAKAAEQQFLGQ